MPLDALQALEEAAVAANATKRAEVIQGGNNMPKINGYPCPA